ncbi:hypothetical protein GQ457_10G002440 [Hibiscus cannabinus]
MLKIPYWKEINFGKKSQLYRESLFLSFEYFIMLNIPHWEEIYFSMSSKTNTIVVHSNSLGVEIGYQGNVLAGDNSAHYTSPTTSMVDWRWFQLGVEGIVASHQVAPYS